MTKRHLTTHTRTDVVQHVSRRRRPQAKIHDSRHELNRINDKHDRQIVVQYKDPSVNEPTDLKSPPTQVVGKREPAPLPAKLSLRHQSERSLPTLSSNHHTAPRGSNLRRARRARDRVQSFPLALNNLSTSQQQKQQRAQHPSARHRQNARPCTRR